MIPLSVKGRKVMVSKPQGYPRISDVENPEYGLLDFSELFPLKNKLPLKELQALIGSAIGLASVKASQEALLIPDEASPEEISKIYHQAAVDILKYFKRSDPASIASFTIGKTCRDVAIELFKKRESHIASMHAGWRNQFLFLQCAQSCGRFVGVSDVGTADSDVNLSIKQSDGKTLNLLVSLKNRLDTISGSKWQGAIEKLENIAKMDKNKTGNYCCIFGLGMHARPYRKMPEKFSVNTEIWPANVLWPFVSGYSYEEVMLEISTVLNQGKQSEFSIPRELLDQFSQICIDLGIADPKSERFLPDRTIKWLCS